MGVNSMHDRQAKLTLSDDEAKYILQLFVDTYSPYLLIDEKTKQEKKMLQDQEKDTLRSASMFVKLLRDYEVERNECKHYIIESESENRSPVVHMMIWSVSAGKWQYSKISFEEFSNNTYNNEIFIIDATSSIKYIESVIANIESKSRVPYELNTEELSNINSILYLSELYGGISTTKKSFERLFYQLEEVLLSKFKNNPRPRLKNALGELYLTMARHYHYHDHDSEKAFHFVVSAGHHGAECGQLLLDIFIEKFKKFGGNDKLLLDVKKALTSDLMVGLLHEIIKASEVYENLFDSIVKHVVEVSGRSYDAAKTQQNNTINADNMVTLFSFDAKVFEANFKKINLDLKIVEDISNKQVPLLLTSLHDTIAKLEDVDIELLRHSVHVTTYAICRNPFSATYLRYLPAITNIALDQKDDEIWKHIAYVALHRAGFDPVKDQVEWEVIIAMLKKSDILKLSIEHPKLFVLLATNVSRVMTASYQCGVEKTVASSTTKGVGVFDSAPAEVPYVVGNFKFKKNPFKQQ